MISYAYKNKKKTLGHWLSLPPFHVVISATLQGGNNNNNNKDWTIL